MLIGEFMPALRGHHLICLHFFGGEGYNQEFIENLKSVLESAGKRGVEVTGGPDEICVKCPYLSRNRCNCSDDADKGIRGMDARALDLLKLSEGMTVTWYELKDSIPGIFEEWYRAYCTGCGWKRACEKDRSFRQLAGLAE